MRNLHRALLLAAVLGTNVLAHSAAQPGGRYIVTATAPVTVTIPGGPEAGENWIRQAAGSWRRLSQATRRGDLLTLTLSSAELTGGKTALVLNKPSWLDLDDDSPPRLLRLRVDGLRKKPAGKVDLGWLDQPPNRIDAYVRDDRNPLDPASVRLAANGAVILPGTAGFRLVRNPEDPREGRLRCVVGALKSLRNRGANHLRLECDDFAPDEKNTTLDLQFTVTNPPVIHLGRPAAVAPSGVKVYVDSVFSGYHNLECVVDGKAQVPGTTTIGCTWASAVTSQDHWICLVLPARRRVTGVRLNWANWRETWWTSRRYEILTWDGGQWQSALRVRRNPPGPVSVHRFAPRATDRVLLWQPAGGGHPQYENIFWLAEVTLLP